MAAILENIETPFDSMMAQNDEAFYIRRSGMYPFMGDCRYITSSTGVHYFRVETTSPFQANGISATKL